MEQPSDGSDRGTGHPCSAAALRQLVAAHRTADGREATSKQRFLRELERLPEPCAEGAGPIHVTASGIVVGDRGTVLHRHRRLGRWMQPGGHIEAGESPSEAARRESEEEIGLPMTHPAGVPMLVHLDVHDAARGHTHLDLRYLLLSADRDPEPPPGESPEARWYSWAEAARAADDSLATGLEVARTQWWRLGAPPPATGAEPGEGR